MKVKLQAQPKFKLKISCALGNAISRAVWHKRNVWNSSSVHAASDSMKTFLPIRVLGLGTLACSALIFSGCSTRTQSTSPIAEAPATSEQMTSPDTNNSAEKEAANQPSLTKPLPDSKKPAAMAIRWEPTLTSAMAMAQKTQKPIMIDFFATWCGPCKMLDAQIYPAAPVVQEAENFVSVKIDVDKEQELAARYQIQAMPTIVFLDSTGKELHRTQGVSDEVSWFVQEMQTARSKMSGTAA